MADIGGVGIEVTVRASNTFPVGFTVTQFADDSDPLDAPAFDIAQTAMGLNGDLLSWDTPNPVPLNLNVIPNGDDDRNLQRLFEENRVGRGKTSAKDIITVTVSYPDGKRVNLTAGKLTNGMAFNSVASAGRLKSKPYSFMFENVTSN